MGSVIFEVTPRCNHDCVHCYAVWKNPGATLPAELGTDEVLRLLDRLLSQCEPVNVTLTGGEPLLRPDIPCIVEHLSGRWEVDVNLITNGSLLDGQRARELVRAGVSLFQISLLAAERELHNRITGSDSFDRVVEGMADLAEAGGEFITVFVATRHNAAHLQEMLELSFALGAVGTMVNRFNPGGAGGRRLEELMPGLAQLEQVFSVADSFAASYALAISTPIPVPPCVIDTAPYRHLEFVECAAGTENAYFALGPTGDLRPCNHSPTVLGNVMQEPLADLVAEERLRPFLEPMPDLCRRCAEVDSCRGGCRAAAEACYGSLCRLEPFVATFGRGPR